MKTHIPFLLACLLPVGALAQTTEERLKGLEDRVKALEEQAKAPKVDSPTPSPTVATNAPIQLVDWNFAFEEGSYSQHQYKITYTLKNLSDKAIKLNQSALSFYDLLGEKITSVRIAPDLKLPPGKPITATGHYP